MSNKFLEGLVFGFVMFILLVSSTLVNWLMGVQLAKNEIIITILPAIAASVVTGFLYFFSLDNLLIPSIFSKPIKFNLETNEKIIFQSQASYLINSIDNKKETGYLFLTESRLIFKSAITNQKLSILLDKIKVINGFKKFYFFNSGISIQSDGDLNTKFIVLNQKKWIEIIKGKKVTNALKADSFIKNFSLIFVFLLSISSLFFACKEKPVHKPKGYFAIDFPKREYQVFQKEGYPYTFEYPVYANVVKDSTFFGEVTENPWWINVEFPNFNGKIYISYKQIGPYKLDTLLRHSFKLANAHTSRAVSLEDSLLHTPNNIHGLMFNVGGNVATNNQFFLTDSTKHFLRGAIYFEATPNEDSINPVNQFVMQDLRHLINTFKWRN